MVLPGYGPGQPPAGPEPGYLMTDRSRLPLMMVLCTGLACCTTGGATGQVDFSHVKGELSSSLARQMSKADQAQQDWVNEQFDELTQHRLVSKVQHKIRRTAQFDLFEADVVTPPPSDLKGLGPRRTSQVLARNSRYSFELHRPG